MEKNRLALCLTERLTSLLTILDNYQGIESNLESIIILALPFSSRVTLEMLLNSSVPLFPHL